MPCAGKTVICEGYKIGICQAGLDNKTGGTQRRLVLPVFVHLRVANHLFFALKSKDSEKGEIVIASVRFFCETANRCIADTVRWGVRIFAVKQNTPQNCKVDR